MAHGVVHFSSVRFGSVLVMWTGTAGTHRREGWRSTPRRRPGRWWSTTVARGRRPGCGSGRRRPSRCRRRTSSRAAASARAASAGPSAGTRGTSTCKTACRGTRPPSTSDGTLTAARTNEAVVQSRLRPRLLCRTLQATNQWQRPA